MVAAKTRMNTAIRFKSVDDALRSQPMRRDNTGHISEGAANASYCGTNRGELEQVADVTAGMADHVLQR